LAFLDFDCFWEFVAGGNFILVGLLSFFGVTACFFELGPSEVEPDSLFRFPFICVGVSVFRLLLSSFRLLLFSSEGADLEPSSIFDLESAFAPFLASGVFGTDITVLENVFRGNFVSTSSGLTLLEFPPWFSVLVDKFHFGATLEVGVDPLSIESPPPDSVSSFNFWEYDVNAFCCVC